MQIPTYWARAVIDASGDEIPNATEETDGFQGVGWSKVSDQDAYEHALKRAHRVRDHYQHGLTEMGDLREQYYSDRPLREPIVDELHHEGQRLAVITRNIYGAYVLNAAHAAFVDIDAPKPILKWPLAPRQPGFFARLLGAKAVEHTPEPEVITSPEQRIRQTIQDQPGLGMKVYKTPNGYRGLVTHQPYDPASQAAQNLLNAFEADQLYVKLCQAQQCFRARLTPKPFRIQMDIPPRIFPFTNPSKQQAYDQWSQLYESRSQDYAACEPLSKEPWGNTNIHPDIAPVLALHDALACSPGKPLA